MNRTQRVFVILGLLSCGVVQKSTVRAQQPQSSPYGEFVDEVSFPSDQSKTGVLRIHSSIVVDAADDNIVELNWYENADHSLSQKKVLQYLGHRVNLCGGVTAEQLTPKNKVATNAIRVTLGHRNYYFVVALGFEKYRQEVPVIEYGLYLYAMGGNAAAAKLIYSEENIGERLEQFIARDLNADGSLEIIDVGRSGDAQIVTIRRLTEDGIVSKLQELDADQRIELHLDYPETGYFITLVNRTRINRKNGPPIVGESIEVKYWSPEERKFVSRKNLSPSGH